MENIAKAYLKDSTDMTTVWFVKSFVSHTRALDRNKLFHKMSVKDVYYETKSKNCGMGKTWRIPIGHEFASESKKIYLWKVFCKKVQLSISHSFNDGELAV